MKIKMTQTINAKKGNAGASGLDLVDLKSLSQEALQTTKLGESQDTYFQAAVKAKKLQSAIFLKTEIGGFPLTYQNVIGNTVLHNAVSLQDTKLFKLVIVEKFKESMLENPTSISDVKGNLKPSLSKVLLLKNQKGLTPL